MRKYSQSSNSGRNGLKVEYVVDGRMVISGRVTFWRGLGCLDPVFSTLYWPDNWHRQHNSTSTKCPFPYLPIFDERKIRGFFYLEKINILSQQLTSIFFASVIYSEQLQFIWWVYKLILQFYNLVFEDIWNVICILISS